MSQAAITVGINGFGRIGRSIFRILHQRAQSAQLPPIRIVAINDVSDRETLAYLLKYDSIMGVLDAEVRLENAILCVDAQRIPLTNIAQPAQLRWQCDVVLEATGIFTNRAALSQHLEAGAKRVLLTVPPKDSLDNMVVLGVNDASLRPAQRLISNASCTTNCLAPIAKILDDSFGIVSGLMTTVHAYTNDQRLSDTPHKDARRSRAAAENIIPTTTGAARAVGKILPQLQGKLDGMAVRVPVPNGSIVDLVVKLARSVSLESLHAAVQSAADGPMRGIVAFCTAPLVSRDILGNPHSCIFDALSTQIAPNNCARVVCWYDNEWGYSNRCVDLIPRLANLSTDARTQ